MRSAGQTEREPFDCGSNNIAASRRLDFNVRLEQDNYVIDVFDSATGNADEAYLTSHECDSWEQVVRYCRGFDGVRVI